MTEPGFRAESCEIGGVCRPHHECAVAGDSWRVFEDPTRLTILVVDGVGHGPEAESAARRTVEVVTSALAATPATGLDELMQACHVALQGTRGAAVALLRVHTVEARVEFCGVGNVAIQAAPRRKGLGVSLPGTVGYRMRQPVVFASPLAPGDTFSLTTDGISSGFDLDEVVGVPAESAARSALSRFGKKHDDATAVVVRFLRPRPVVPQ